MYQPTQMHAEVEYRQKKTHAEYIHAQRQVSVIGLRQIIGNTIIEFGGRIHGMAQSSCEGAAEAGVRVRKGIHTSDTRIQTTGVHS